jgi:hypothetical protein
VAGAATIVEREALRGQRRWQTFAFRGAFVGALFVLFALQYRDMTRWQDWSQPEELAYVGSRLFEFTMYAQWWLLGLLTPILVAQGIVEERNQGTLELLTISRITPGQLLRGKVLSSLSTLCLLILGGMPIVALCLAFGGVAPLSLVIAYACTAVAVLTLASLSAYFALFARGPLGPLVFSWIGAFWGWILMALPAVVALDDDDGFGWVSLGLVFAKSLDDPALWMLWPCVLWTVVSAVVLGLAARVFSSLLASGHGEDSDGALLSVEIWGLERLRRRLGLQGVLLVGTSPVVVASAMEGGRVGWLLGLSFAWVLLALFTTMLALLLAARGLLLEAASVTRTRRLGRADRRALVEGPARVRGQRPLGMRQVWGNPVAWRETVTRAHGFLTSVAGRGYILGLGVVALLVVFQERIDNAHELFVSLSVMGFVGTAVLAVLLATSTMVAEQRRGTLALLCVTRMGGMGIVRGKMLGLLAYLLPPFAVSSVCALMGSMWFAGYRPWWGTVPDTQFMIQRTLSLVWLAASATTFLAAASLWLAVRARTATRAWLRTLGFASFLALGPALALGIARGREPVRSLVAFINPILSDRFWQGNLPTHAGASGGVWLTLAVLLLVHNARTLQRVAR